MCSCAFHDGARSFLTDLSPPKESIEQINILDTRLSRRERISVHVLNVKLRPARKEVKLHDQFMNF